MSDIGLGAPIMTGEDGQKDVHAGGAVFWKFQLSAESSEVTLSFDIVTVAKGRSKWIFPERDRKNSS